MTPLTRVTEDEYDLFRYMLEDLEVYYGVKLPQRQMSMYIEDLLEMGAAQLSRAIVGYRREWNSDKFPLPAQLRKQIAFMNSCSHTNK